jgi:hypothetical protein
VGRKFLTDHWSSKRSVGGIAILSCKSFFVSFIEEQENLMIIRLNRDKSAKACLTKIESVLKKV